jgi:DAPG hydrolase PhiG domain
MPKRPPKYTGYTDSDRKTPWARYFNEKMSPLQPHVTDALANSPLDPIKLPPLEAALEMARPGYSEAETGYAHLPGGEMRVAILTKMLRVSPEMWDWWFGWHGSRDNRYKLWHPLAHISAGWQDGGEEVAYIGRTSMIQEYIGPSFAKANISFIPPCELGIAATEDQVFICARVGYTSLPVNFGWLIHQVRKTSDGAEMRSRFWMGGPHIAFRGNETLTSVASRLLQKIARPPKRLARDLLIHCAEEMSHLAQFLPELYAEFKIAETRTK